MTPTKSPFLVFQNFLDRSICDNIAETVRVVPTLNDDDKPQSMERHHLPSEAIVYEQFKPLVPKIEAHFDGYKYRGCEHLVFQQFPVNGEEYADPPHCENSVFKRKKWIKVKDRDLTGVLWLKDYQESPPFNVKTQVLGGKLEFPAYSFGLQAQKGTLVIYPSDPHFISVVTTILVGELQAVRFHLVGEGAWLYDPAKYPGNFVSWFQDIV